MKGGCADCQGRLVDSQGGNVWRRFRGLRNVSTLTWWNTNCLIHSRISGKKQLTSWHLDTRAAWIYNPNAIWGPPQPPSSETPLQSTSSLKCFLWAISSPSDLWALVKAISSLNYLSLVKAISSLEAISPSDLFFEVFFDFCVLWTIFCLSCLLSELSLLQTISFKSYLFSGLFSLESNYFFKTTVFDLSELFFLHWACFGSVVRTFIFKTSFGRGFLAKTVSPEWQTKSVIPRLSYKSVFGEHFATVPQKNVVVVTVLLQECPTRLFSECPATSLFTFRVSYQECTAGSCHSEWVVNSCVWVFGCAASCWLFLALRTRPQLVVSSLLSQVRADSWILSVSTASTIELFIFLGCEQFMIRRLNS